MREIEKPIVFIGVGRSGTTVVDDTFAAHSDLAWVLQYLNRLPQPPSVTLLSRLADRVPSSGQRRCARISAAWSSAFG